MAAVTTIDGVRIPDQAMADLLLLAQSQGFRLEAGTGGRHAEHTGMTVYPPNKEHPPIRVGCVEVNPRHVGNVRRSLVRAGLVIENKGAEPMPTPRKRKGAVSLPAPADSLAPLPDATSSSISSVFAGLNEDDKMSAAMAIASQACAAAGLREGTAALAGLFVATLQVWEREDGRHAVDRRDLEAAQQEATEALRMASEAEADVTRLRRAAERAEARAEQAAADCAAALRRAEAAEAERDELRRAIDPLRALLGKSA